MDQLYFVGHWVLTSEKDMNSIWNISEFREKGEK